MSTYAVLIRGINVGGRKVPMPRLRTLVEELGYEDVSTYIQSGNVIVNTTDKTAAVERAVEKLIKDEWGFEVSVMVRTPTQLKKVVDGNPFLATATDLSKLHVVFLASKPPAAKVKALAARDWGDDEVAVKGTEAYLHLPNGYGRANLNNMIVEKQLGVAGTARNWRTTTKLLELLADGKA